MLTMDAFESSLTPEAADVLLSFSEVVDRRLDDLGRVSSEDEKLVCSREMRSQRQDIYSRISTIPRGSERSE